MPTQEDIMDSSRATDASPASGVKASFWQRRVLQPVISQLRQGVTPEKLSQSLAWGAVLGIIPILGTSTLLAGIVAIRLKLNHVAIQVTNWLIYPLQILLIIPFLRAGNWLFMREQVPLSIQEITNAFSADFFAALSELGWLAARAIVAWSLLALPMVVLLTMIFTPVMRQLNDRIHGRKVRS